jgi:hypothetical protein
MGDALLTRTIPGRQFLPPPKRKTSALSEELKKRRTPTLSGEPKKRRASALSEELKKRRTPTLSGEPKKRRASALSEELKSGSTQVAPLFYRKRLPWKS